MTKYTNFDLKMALNTFRSKKLKSLAAGQQFNIRVATLYARLSGIRGNGARSAKTTLSSEEDFLVQTI